MSDTMTLPFIKDSETSRDAAKALEADQNRLTDMHLRLMRAYKDAGKRGLTDPEMQAKLVMNGSTQRPRRVELAQKGKIRKTGERRNGCAVWVMA